MGNEGSNDNTSKLFSAISPPPFSSLYRKWIHNSMIYPLRDTIYGERPMISYPFPPYAKRISSAKQISYRQVYHPFPQGTDIISMIYRLRDMIYGIRRMIYLLRKHDIISVPSIREAYIICEADIIPPGISPVPPGNGYH